MIEAIGLVKDHGSLRILDGISLQVARGEVAAIIGPSGGGKSTFLRCLNGLERFQGGSVVIDGERLVAGVHEREREAILAGVRRKVGMVFQGFNLFPHLTVLENAVKAPMVVKRLGRAAAERQARELLVKVGLGDRLDYYPSQLSGGQQQRAAIARALAMSPKVMLYDEPTSALDPSLVGEVLNIMRRLDDEGMTQVVVTHEMRFAREVADRIIVLGDGELIEAGPPEVIFSAPRDGRTRDFLRSFL